ncbi:MAG: hypothetical protein Q9199_007679 [Rusavskia elegans]
MLPPGWGPTALSPRNLPFLPCWESNQLQFIALPASLDLKLFSTFLTVLLHINLLLVMFFGNASVNGTATWVPEPNGRGTWSLLSTCIITVSLCVWSAVHLNIRQHHKASSQYWRKAKWLLLGIFAPELLAYIAWQQRQDASELCRAVRAIYNQKNPPGYLEKITQSVRSLHSTQKSPEKDPESTPDPIPLKGINAWDFRLPHAPPPSRTAQWELVHGFYALMGGFTLAVEPQEFSSIPNKWKFESFLPDHITRATLTSEGIRFLLYWHSDALPSITAEQIWDKSKADGLKKTLVCAQALWFCIQCLTRLAQSLPVSLLELNTFGHALCTLAIYVFWWDKPLDIEEPTTIEDHKLYPLFSYMWMTSNVSAQGHCDYDMPDGLQDEFHCFWPFKEPNLNDLSVCKNIYTSRLFTRGPVAEDPESHKREEEDLIQKLEILSDCGKIEALKARVHGTTNRQPYISPFRRVQYGLRSCFFPTRPAYGKPAGLGIRNTAISQVCASDVVRSGHALNAILSYDLQGDLLRRHKIAASGLFFNRTLGIHIPFLDALQDNGLNSRLELRARNAVLSITPSGILPGFAIAGALYGGLHLVAWSAPLSSRLEEQLWRIAGSSVTCTGIVVGLLALIGKTDFCKQSLSNSVKVVTRKPLDASTRGEKVREYFAAVGMGLLACVILPCLPLLWFLYLASRGYLVVESLKNIAYLPPGSFETPVWPSYFPHIA